jgi:hypothetical protein
MKDSSSFFGHAKTCHPILFASPKEYLNPGSVMADTKNGQLRLLDHAAPW